MIVRTPPNPKDAARRNAWERSISQSMPGCIAFVSERGSNVANIETTLLSADLPARVLRKNGDSIRFRAAGVFSGSGFNKALTAYLTNGTDITTLYTSTLFAWTATDLSWCLEGEIFRTGPEEERHVIHLMSDDILKPADVLYDESEFDLETNRALTLEIAGTSTIAGDVEGYVLKVDWLPGQLNY